MMANFKEKQWEWKGEKYKAKPGQFVTSLENIAKECGKGVSVQNVRTALTRFEKLEFLTNESTKTGRLITIANWEVYQSVEENQQSDQQSPNKDLTTREEGNKVNKFILSELDFAEIRSYFKGTKNLSVAKKKLPGVVKKYGKETIICAIKKYTKEVEFKRNNGFKDLQFVNESTFWNGRYIDYLDSSQDVKEIKPIVFVERDVYE
jgi:hypothetical protein